MLRFSGRLLGPLGASLGPRTGSGTPELSDDWSRGPRIEPSEMHPSEPKMAQETCPEMIAILFLFKLMFFVFVLYYINFFRFSYVFRKKWIPVPHPMGLTTGFDVFGEKSVLCRCFECFLGFLVIAVAFLRCFRKT